MLTRRFNNTSAHLKDPLLSLIRLLSWVLKLVCLFSCLFKSYKVFISNFRWDQCTCIRGIVWLQWFLELAFSYHTVMLVQRKCRSICVVEQSVKMIKLAVSTLVSTSQHNASSEQPSARRSLSYYRKLFGVNLNEPLHQRQPCHILPCCSL